MSSGGAPLVKSQRVLVITLGMSILSGPGVFFNIRRINSGKGKEDANSQSLLGCEEPKLYSEAFTP